MNEFFFFRIRCQKLIRLAYFLGSLIFTLNFNSYLWANESPSENKKKILSFFSNSVNRYFIFGTCGGILFFEEKREFLSLHIFKVINSSFDPQCSQDSMNNLFIQFPNDVKSFYSSKGIDSSFSFPELKLKSQALSDFYVTHYSLDIPLAEILSDFGGIYISFEGAQFLINWSALKVAKIISFENLEAKTLDSQSNSEESKKILSQVRAYSVSYDILFRDLLPLDAFNALEKKITYSSFDEKMIWITDEDILLEKKWLYRSGILNHSFSHPNYGLPIDYEYEHNLSESMLSSFKNKSGKKLNSEIKEYNKNKNELNKSKAVSPYWGVPFGLMKVIN